jgi:hypothetical protein
MALKVKTSVDGSGFAAGLEKMMEDARHFGQNVSGKIAGNFSQAIMGVVPGLSSAIAGIFAADTLKEKIGEFASEAHKVTIGAVRLNVSEETYQKLNNVMEESGQTADDAAGAFDKLAEAAVKIDQGDAGATKLKQAFAELGVSLDQIASKDYQSLFFKISQGLQGITPSAQQIAALREIFGRSGDALLPALKAGFEGPLANRHIISDEDLKQMESYRKMRTETGPSLFGAAWHAVAKEGSFFGDLFAGMATKKGINLMFGVGEKSYDQVKAEEKAKQDKADADAKVAAIVKQKIANDDLEAARLKAAEKANKEDRAKAAGIEKETDALKERNRVASMTPEQKRLEMLNQIRMMQGELDYGNNTRTQEAEYRKKIEALRGEIAAGDRAASPLEHHAAIGRALGNAAFGGMMLGHGTAGEREVASQTRRAADHLARIDERLHAPQRRGGRLDDLGGFP